MKLRVLFGVFGVALGISASAQTALTKKLERFSSSFSSQQDQIPADRKEQLSQLADAIIYSTQKNGNANVVFADESNTAISQLSQAVFQVAVHINNLPKINSYSAGIREAAIDAKSVTLLKEAGFNVEVNKTFRENPRYLVNYSWKENRLLMFSKLFDNYQIPGKSMIVVKAGAFELPQNQGIEKVISLNYGEVNKTTFDQIAREMFYVAQKVQNNQLLSHKE